MSKYADITADLGPLYSDGETRIPMFSYTRPAYTFWQAVYGELRTIGWTHAKAIEFLQSKHTRWMFDGESTDAVEFIAKMCLRLYVAHNNLKKNEI